MRASPKMPPPETIAVQHGKRPTEPVRHQEHIKISSTVQSHLNKIKIVRKTISFGSVRILNYKYILLFKCTSLYFALDRKCLYRGYK